MGFEASNGCERTNCCSRTVTVHLEIQPESSWSKGEKKHKSTAIQHPPRTHGQFDVTPIACVLLSSSPAHSQRRPVCQYSLYGTYDASKQGHTFPNMQYESDRVLCSWYSTLTFAWRLCRNPWQATSITQLPDSLDVRQTGEQSLEAFQVSLAGHC